MNIKVSSYFLQVKSRSCCVPRTVCSTAWRTEIWQSWTSVLSTPADISSSTVQRRWVPYPGTVGADPDHFHHFMWILIRFFTFTGSGFSHWRCSGSCLSLYYQYSTYLANIFSLFSHLLMTVRFFKKNVNPHRSKDRTDGTRGSFLLT